MSVVSTVCDRLHNVGRSVAWRYPRAYRRLGMWRRGADAFDLDYDLAIEGFPRSANTYVAHLLNLTQPELKISSHRHAPPFAVVALDHGKSVFFLLRDPRDCVTSYAIMMQTPVLRQLLYYIVYHKALRAQRQRLFIANFKSITTDTKAVLRAYSERTGMPLRLDFDLEKVHAEIFSRIDQNYRNEQGELNLRKVNRPVPERQEWKDKLVEELYLPKNRRWLEIASNLYEEFQQSAV